MVRKILFTKSSETTTKINSEQVRTGWDDLIAILPKLMYKFKPITKIPPAVFEGGVESDFKVNIKNKRFRIATQLIKMKSTKRVLP